MYNFNISVIELQYLQEIFIFFLLLFSHPAEPLYLFMLGKALDLVITEKIIFLFVEFSTNIKVSLSFRQ